MITLSWLVSRVEQAGTHDLERGSRSDLLPELLLDDLYEARRPYHQLGDPKPTAWKLDRTVRL